MTDTPDLKVVDFKKAKDEAEKPPDFLIEKIKLLKDKAAEGKLKICILHFDYENDDGEMEGGTMLWHSNSNALELLGLAEIVKSSAMHYAYEMMHSEEEHEE